MQIAQAAYHIEPKNYQTSTPNSLWASLFKSQRYTIELSCKPSDQSFFLTGYTSNPLGLDIVAGRLTVYADGTPLSQSTLDPQGHFEIILQQAAIYTLELDLLKEEVLISSLKIGLP